MKISMIATENAYSLIKNFEGLGKMAYKCPAGRWTIGYGHTGADVTEGMTITEEEADAFLRADVTKCVAALNELIIQPINQNQFDSLVSWVYNLGGTNLRNSTMLKEINQGHYLKAALEMERWNKVNEQPLAGLIRRRQAEVRLYLTPWEAGLGSAVISV
jgi:lysozyme